MGLLKFIKNNHKKGFDYKILRYSIYTIFIITIVSRIMNHSPSTTKIIETLFSYNQEKGTYIGWEEFKSTYASEDFIYNMGNNEDLIFIKLYGRFEMQAPELVVDKDDKKEKVRYHFNNKYVTNYYEIKFYFDKDGKIYRFVETEVWIK